MFGLPWRAASVSIRQGLPFGLKAAAAIAACLALAGCGGGRQAESNPQVYKLGDKVPEGGGTYKVGEPYQIKGRWYRPSETPDYVATGVASWYGEYFHGRKTANGEWYDMERLSAAHPTLPLPAYVRVTNMENGRSIVVRVNDRGPYARDREIDMSWAAARELGFVRAGTARVQVKYIGVAPLEGDVADMQYVDGGPGMRGPGGPNRPFFTASASAGGKARASTGPRSSPLAAKLLTDAPLPTRKPLGTVGVAGRKPPRVAPATTAATTATTGEGPTPILPKGFFVRAASFRNVEYARSFREDLAALGVAEILPVEFGSGTLYQVRVGPFAELQGALEVQSRLARNGHRDARITRE